MANEIEEIKGRLDLVDLVGQYVQVKKAGANYKASCPFHQEKTASLMISPEKQIWKCFGCGKGGDVYKFVMEAEHLEFGDALRLLAQRTGVKLQPRTSAEYQVRDTKDTLYRLNNLVSLVFQKLLLEHPSGQPALAYLKKRGITEVTIKQFRIGWAPERFGLKQFLLGKGFSAADITKAGNPDRFFNRIIFPIFDVLGNVVGFTGRALGDIQPKYLNSPETPLYNKSRLLYGLNLAKAAIKERDYVVLVEGQMDVVALHQAGINQTVASSGTAITETQLQILSKYTQNFLLGFDADGAGQTTTKKVIEMLLRLDLNSKVVEYRPYKDAGELLEKQPDGWAKVAKAAKEGVDWWIEQEIAAAGNLTYIENKKKVLRALLPVLTQVTEPTRLDHYVGRLAAQLHLSADSIKLSLQRQTSHHPSPTAAPPATPTELSAQLHLTNEEQLLALLIARPKLIAQYITDLNEVVWQSVDTATLAEAIKQWYTDKALVTNQPQFVSRVKTILSGPLAEKVDAWQFWLANQWPELADELATELITEKLQSLTTKRYERQKTDLALAIRQAQEAGDVTKIKQLMTDLNKLTKKGE